MSFWKKSLSTFAAQIVQIFLGMASSILIARTLGPELNGKIILLTTAINLLFMMGNFGLGSSFTYFIARDEKNSNEIIPMSFILSILLGLLLIGGFFVSFKFHSSLWEGIDFSIIFFSICLVPLFILNNNLSRIMMGFNKIYELNICSILRSTINLVLLIVVVLAIPMGVFGVIVSICISSLCASGIMIFFIWANIKKMRFFDSDMLLKCFSYGIKSYLLILINFLNYRVDLFLIKYFRSDIEVGYYSLAVGIAEMIWLIPNSTVSTLFPTVAASNDVNKSIISMQVCRWSLLFLLLISFGVILFGKFAILIVYGIEYLPSFEPLLYLLPGVVLFPIFKILTVDLSARGFPGYGTFSSLIALIINICFNIILIPRWGTIGAAVSTSISYTIMSAIVLYFFCLETEYRLKDILLIPKFEFALVIKKVRSFLPIHK